MISIADTECANAYPTTWYRTQACVVTNKSGPDTTTLLFDVIQYTHADQSEERSFQPNLESITNFGDLCSPTFCILILVASIIRTSFTFCIAFNFIYCYPPFGTYFKHNKISPDKTLSMITQSY